MLIQFLAALLFPPLLGRQKPPRKERTGEEKQLTVKVCDLAAAVISKSLLIL